MFCSLFFCSAFSRVLNLQTNWIQGEMMTALNHILASVKYDKTQNEKKETILAFMVLLPHRGYFSSSS